MDEARKNAVKGEACMNDLEFDALLMAARPSYSRANTDFTDTVMRNIHQPDILSSVVRKISVNKKETLIMKLKHLPRIAIVAIALGALVVVSSGAYAAYQLFWAKPAVHVLENKTSVSGREEVVLSTEGCDTMKAKRYELKKGATIGADRVSAVVQAQCELQAIQNWAQQTYADAKLPNLDTLQPNDTPVKETTVSVSMATHLQSKQSDSLTFASIDKYGFPQTTLRTDKNVKYIVNGKNASLDDIKEGDAVAYVFTRVHFMTRNQNGSIDTDNTPNQVLVAVVKLSMPFDDYDQFAWQSLSEREACYGNPNEDCVTGGASIDLYIGGSSTKVSDTTLMKEIQGTVVALKGNETLIKSSSGAVYTVTTPTDVISNYNTTKAAQYYNNQKVELGSSIIVKYVEEATAHATDISADYMYFQIELVSKGDAVKAY